MFSDKSARFAMIVILLIWLLTVQGTVTVKICDNASGNYSKRADIDYIPNAKAYDYCNCTIRGAGTMTIHNYRSASPALYCPSTLYVNNYYYNCSPYNGFSANDKLENEILPSDRETAVTLIFQSQSNQPILRLEFKGQSNVHVICNGRPSLPWSPKMSAENSTTAVTSPVTVPMSTERENSTTSVTQSGFDGETITENLHRGIGLVAGLSVGVGVLAAIIFTALVMALHRKFIANRRTAQPCNAVVGYCSQQNTNNDKLMESENNDHLYATINDISEHPRVRNVFNATYGVQPHCLILEKSLTDSKANDESEQVTSNTIGTANNPEPATNGTGTVVVGEETAVNEENAYVTGLSSVASISCDLYAQNNNNTKHRQNQELKHTYSHLYNTRRNRSKSARKHNDTYCHLNTDILDDRDVKKPALSLHFKTNNDRQLVSEEADHYNRAISDVPNYYREREPHPYFILEKNFSDNITNDESNTLDTANKKELAIHGKGSTATEKVNGKNVRVADPRLRDVASNAYDMQTHPDNINKQRQSQELAQTFSPMYNSSRDSATSERKTMSLRRNETYSYRDLVHGDFKKSDDMGDTYDHVQI